MDNGIDEGVIETLEGWVGAKTDAWRNHFSANYQEKFDEYYRLWRGQWDNGDSTRKSERSKIVAPALQQAVESNVAEIEEATFGRGNFFDLRDDASDVEKGDTADIQKLRKILQADFKKNKIRKATAEVLINAAVFGTGVAEIVMTTIKDMKPATQPVMEGDLTAVGVTVSERTAVTLVPIMPQNFLIDPLATSIEEALGVATDRMVPKHQVEEDIEAGIYRDVDITSPVTDFDIEPDKGLTSIYEDDKVRLTKYYGLVPRHLLAKARDEDEAEEITTLGEDTAFEEEGEYMVEAIVIIANDGILLKAEENPYMMADRPVVAFPWDVVPSRFWGRGVCEKGYNSQKALDAELRARIDALALTIHPMMGMDASRMPRGSKPEVRPGKVVLTNGNPAEILQPFNFGNVNQVTFAQADALQRMVQSSTGAVDSAGISGSINGEGTAAGISMSLGAIVKRHKRTLINFQEAFLIPFVEKAAWRYMQFEPELFPVGDYNFEASSSLGVIAREYEVGQLVQLLQTTPADAPQHSIILKAITENMSIANREELIAAIEASNQPNPEAQKAAQATHEAQMAFQAAQTQALTAQAQEFSAKAQESQARAAKVVEETKAIPVSLETDRIKALSANLDDDDEAKDFERRIKLGGLMLKEREVASKESPSTPPVPPTQRGLPL